TIFYLLPLLFGPVNNSTMSDVPGWAGMRSYWGIVPSMLATMAVFSLIFAYRKLQARSYRFLISFFFIMLTMMILKRFASPIINWVGLLPISEMVLYLKYQEPSIALCIAMLAGLGLSVLIELRVGWGIVAAAALALAGFMYGIAGPFWPQVLHVKRFAFFYYLSLSAGTLFVLVTLVTAMSFVLSNSPLVRRRLISGLIGVLCLELVVNYIVPSFYIYGVAPPAARSPFKGAPFLDFLRARNTEHDRVFARDGMLYPNWAAAFELADVRSLDAMYYRRYLAFIRSFLLAPGDHRQHGDLADRFTGSEGTYDFSTVIEKRFLALSSVRYLISSRAYNTSSAQIGDMTWAPAFAKIYDSEVKVYEISPTLPRASVFGRIEILPDEQVLARLKDASFRPEESIILSREFLADVDPATLRSLEGQASSASGNTAATIVSYQSQRVEIEANAGSTSLLMLTDTNYPGWRAFVNGQPAPIVSANYLFRGVVVPKGKSKVEFVYQPGSFRLGATISITALIALGGLLLWERRRPVKRLQA
ncbi:MAG: hypothetical protein V7606_2383, partial [Burkholderiales bacterium]